MEALEAWLQKLVGGAKGSRAGGWTYRYIAELQQIECWENGQYIDHQSLNWYRDNYKSHVRALETDRVIEVGGE